MMLGCDKCNFAGNFKSINQMTSKIRVILAALMTLFIASDAIAGEIFEDGLYRYEVTNFWGYEDTDEVVIVGLTENAKLPANLVLPSTVKWEGVTYSVAGLGLSDYSTHYGDAPVIGYSTAVKHVTIPSTMRIIGQNEFLGCPNIIDYTVEAGNPEFVSRDGILYEDLFSDALMLYRYPSARNTVAVNIPAIAGYVGPGAFAANKYVKKIYLSGHQRLRDFWQLGNNSITSVGCESTYNYREEEEGVIYFAGNFECVCPGLKKDEFTFTGTTIPRGAFCNSSIKKIKVNASEIEPYAFMWADVEKFVTMSRPPYSFGTGCFMHAKKLGNISLGTNPAGNCEISEQAFYGCESLQRITLDSGISTIHIENSAFDGCSSLTEFPITSKMRISSLGGRAFADCKKLESFPLGTIDAMDRVGYQFEGSGLTTVNWPSSLPEVPFGCFKDCKSLKKVNLKMSTKEIEPLAFQGSGLTGISMMGVELYSSTSFLDCDGLTKVYFPETENDVDYSSISFVAPNSAVIVNNHKIQWLYAQDYAEGAKAKLYISLYSPENPNIGDNWEAIYVPGRANETYKTLSKAPVKEMYTYRTVKKESKVILGQLAPGVKITGVNIEGVAATANGNEWAAKVKPSAGSKMNVEVNYTVGGNQMRTVYEYPFEDSGVDEMKSVSSDHISVLSESPERIVVSDAAQWEIISLSGRTVLAGHSEVISLEGLSSGVYLIRFPEHPDLTFKHLR